MAKKAIKKLTKSVEKLQERNEELHRELTEKVTAALEKEAETSQALHRALEERLDALEGDREPETEAPEAADAEEPQAEPVMAEEQNVPEDLEVTEAARQKADELGVNLEGVEGTGSEGRILVKDVEEAARPES